MATEKADELIELIGLQRFYIDSVTRVMTETGKLWVDGEIIKKSNSFQTVEEEFVKECAKKHDGGHGRIDIVKHKIVNNKVEAR